MTTGSNVWTLLLWLLVAPAAVVALGYLIAPLFLWRKHPVAMDPKHEPTAATDLTPEMAAFIGDVLAPFAAEGFEVAANVRELDTIPGATAVLVLLVNRATGDTASVGGTWIGPARSLLFGVDSRFPDGAAVTTVHQRQPGIYPRDRRRDSLELPFVHDVHALCEAHRRRLRAAGRESVPRVPITPGDEVAVHDRERTAEMERLVRARLYYRHEPTRTYRKTLLGSYVFVWKLLPPVGRIRYVLFERRARAAWARLGMHEWTADRASAAVHDPAADTDTDATAPSTAADLQYDVSLPDGETRVHTGSGGAVTVRSGGAPVPRHLARQWSHLLFLAILAILTTLLGFTWWRRASVLSQLGVPWNQLLPDPFLAVIAALTLLNALFLLWSAARQRRTVVLTASRAGLSFRNAPRGRRDGHIDRADLASLLVIYEPGSLRRRYQLRAVRHDGRAQILLAGRPKAGLEAIRHRLLQGMGIERPDAVASEPESASAPDPR